MKILITNDDGWGFSGIEALSKIAESFGEVWVVAPDHPMSGISHQLTFESSMRWTEKAPQSYALAGTPADCIRVAHAMLDVEFDLVLSGINNGANLGVDRYVSGTVAGAREACFFNRPAIAISQYLFGLRPEFEWDLSASLTHRVIEQLIDRGLETGTFYNVNLPDTQGEPVDDVEIVFTHADNHPLPIDFVQHSPEEIIYTGAYRNRARSAGSDIEVCFGGAVSVSKHSIAST